MSTNRSVIRTKKAIREAFIELLAEKKSIDKITIIELTERANIVRSTFYSHYEDIYAVAKEFQLELMLALKENLTSYIESGMKDLSAPMTRMIDFFHDNESEYKRLISSGYDENQFLCQLKDTISKELFEKIIFPSSEIFTSRKLEARFYSNICVDLVADYFRGAISLSLYEIRDFLLALAKRLEN